MEPFRIVITDIKDTVALHLFVKREFPFIFKKRLGKITTGEFMTSYGINEAQRVHKVLNSNGAEAKIEKA